MPEITYVQPDGTHHVQNAEPGQSIMEAAVQNGVPGIVGECGGALSCSTCHVYLDDDVQGEFAPLDDVEDEMLDGVAAERTPRSRLSCQLQPSASTPAGMLRVHTPDRQY